MNTFSAALRSNARTGTAGTEPGAGARGIRSILNTVERWQIRSRTRRHLRELDDRLLSDVGLDRDTAKQEARKHYWQR